MYTIIAGSQYQELGNNTYEKAIMNLFYANEDATVISKTEVDLKVFKDGEMSPVLKTSVRDQTVIIIMSTDPKADNLMELLLLADACKESHCKEVVAIVPYLGYCRQDRKNNERTSIGIGLVGRLLKTARIDKIVNLDLHAIQIQSVFSAVGIQSSHLEGHNIFAKHIGRMNLKDLVFVSPDTGGIGRTRALKQHFHRADLVGINKVRLEANKIDSMTLMGSVKGKNAIIVDDLIDTGGTLCKAADYLLQEGATSVRAVITHPLMSGGIEDGGAFHNLMNSGIEELITTNSITSHIMCPKVKYVDLSCILSDVIFNLIKGNSISRLNNIGYMSVKDWYTN